MPSAKTLIKIGNTYFEESTDYVAWPYGTPIKDVCELEKLKLLPNLHGASFAGSDLRDAGLMILLNIGQLKSLDLQETQITNDGLSYLKELEHLSSKLPGCDILVKGHGAFFYGTFNGT
jgi:hypothetical protein